MPATISTSLKLTLMQPSQWRRDKGSVQTHMLPTEQNGHHLINKEIAARVNKKLPNFKCGRLLFLIASFVIDYTFGLTFIDTFTGL